MFLLPQYVLSFFPVLSVLSLLCDLGSVGRCLVCVHVLHFPIFVLFKNDVYFKISSHKVIGVTLKSHKVLNPHNWVTFLLLYPVSCHSSFSSIVTKQYIVQTYRKLNT